MSLTKASYSMINGAVINVKDFGATGDGSTDDSDAIQAAFDYAATLGNHGEPVQFRRSGGTIWFPNGTYRTTKAIVPLPAVYNVEGTGRFKVYPQLFVPEPDCLATIWADHSERNAFTFYSNNDEISFRMFGINIVTTEGATKPTAAIGLRSGNEFQRDMTLDYVGIFGFTSAIDLYDTNGIQGKGVLKVWNCAINRNANIIRCLDNNVLNILLFQGNEAGSNTNGFSLRGDVLVIEDNSLESINNCISVNGAYRGLSIKKNYWEANGGDYLIQLGSTNGAIIEDNYVNTPSASNYIQLTSDSNTRIHETDMIAQPNGSFNLQTLNNAIKPSSANTASVAMYFDPSLIKSVFAEGVGTLYNTVATATGYHKNIPDSAGETYTTSGSGLGHDINITGLSTSANSWIIMGVLVTYDSELDSDLYPYIELLPNGSSNPADGYVAAQWPEYNNSAPLVQNQTVLYTVVTKAVVSMTSLRVRVYPYGVNTSSGKVCVMSRPFVYTSGSSLDGMFGGNMQPFVPPEQVHSAPAAPTTGTWPTGWKVNNSAPTSGGYVGWVCTSGGSPGTWKGFGTIA